jgi:hypothetical protein
LPNVIAMRNRQEPEAAQCIAGLREPMAHLHLSMWQRRRERGRMPRYDMAMGTHIWEHQHGADQLRSPAKVARSQAGHQAALPIYRHKRVLHV